jgi:hypothetical protein
MTHSLSGRNSVNFINLKGKLPNQKIPVSVKIKKIKERILEDYLMPIFTNQPEKLSENIFFIDKIQKNINNYYETYKLDELVVYNELLKVIKIFVDNNETTHHSISKTNNSKSKDIISMVFKTTKIKLLPEYEIYDSIIGKPQKELNQKYNNDIIITIKTLLEQENITYNKIKEYITTTYDVTF